MRPIRYTLMLLMLFSIATCNIPVSYTITSGKVSLKDVPAGLSSHDGPLLRLTFKAAEQLRKQNASEESIKNVQLKKVLIKTTERSTNKKLDFVETLRVMIGAEGLPTIEVATYDASQIENGEIVMTSLGLELRDYLLKEEIDISLHGKIDRFERATEIKADFVLELTVDAALACSK